MKRSLVRAALLAASSSLACVVAHTATAADATYPARPVRVIVPFAPGGTTDIVGRAVSQRLADALAQPFVVENVAGAATMVGAERVAKSAPDGYTLLVASSTTLATNPYLYRKIAYRMEDFAAVSLLTKYPQVFAVGPAVPAKNLQEFVAYAKTRSVSYGTSARGGIAHVAGEMIAQAIGVKMVDIPYKGSGPAMADLMGGSLQANIDGAPTSLPLHRAGKIRVLATMGEQRADAAPDVPTFVESGYPKLVSNVLTGLFAPAGTPREVIDKLNGALRRILADEAFRARFAPDGMTAEWTTPERCLEMYRADYETIGAVIRSMNLELQ